MPRVTELFAYVIADTDEDDEGVPAFAGPDGMWMPMVGANAERAESLREFAQQIATDMGKPVKLLRSTGLELVEVLEPEPEFRPARNGTMR